MDQEWTGDMSALNPSKDLVGRNHNWEATYAFGRGREKAFEENGSVQLQDESEKERASAQSPPSRNCHENVLVWAAF